MFLILWKMIHPIPLGWRQVGSGVCGTFLSWTPWLKSFPIYRKCLHNAFETYNCNFLKSLTIIGFFYKRLCHFSGGEANIRHYWTAFRNVSAISIAWKKNQNETKKISIQKRFCQGGVNMKEIIIFLSIISDISSA